MSEPAIDDARPRGSVDRLLEDSWQSRSRPVSRRELLVEALAGALFLACAVPLAALALSTQAVNLPLVVLLVGLYAAASRMIRFPLGAGYVVPSYLVLVPMLLLLPPGLVPLLTAAGLVVGTAGQVAAGVARPKRILLSIPDAWHALGPAVVLLLAGSVQGGARLALVYVAAFIAGCLLDLLSATAREAAILGIGARVQLRVIAVVWLVDACLAPLGLLIAQAVRHDPAKLLLMLPLNVVLLLMSRDRNARIAQAARRLEQATTDSLTKLGNRRKLAADMDERLTSACASNPLVLILFDLDGFKSYNDTFGHMAGDAVLARLGGKLAKAVGGHGSAYRLGGDEFCALLRAPASGYEGLVAAAAEALEERGENFAVSASYGAVLLPQEAANVDYAMQLADQRMYTRKRGRPSFAGDHTREVLMRVISAKQPALQIHSSEVAQLCLRVGRRFAMSTEELDELVRAAELHDIGKVGIPDAILEKPGPLNEAEWEFMHQHTVLGERILSATPALRPVGVIVRSTHERWDGGGYPDGLAADRIPLGARIIAACDAYDAMTSQRCYSGRRDRAAALQELRREAGRQFDPTVVESLLHELSRTGQHERTDASASETPQDGARQVAAQVYEAIARHHGTEHVALKA